MQSYCCLLRVEQFLQGGIPELSDLLWAILLFRKAGLPKRFWASGRILDPIEALRVCPTCFSLVDC